MAEWLEREYREGKVKKEEVWKLKHGTGRCIIYTDLTDQPDKSITTTGKIAMDYNSMIGWHVHETDMEEITVLEGEVEINWKTYHVGETFTCHKGKGHYCMNIHKGESVIKFVKK